MDFRYNRYDEQSMVAYALLVNLGCISNIVRFSSDPKCRQELRSINERGLVAVRVGEDESPGDYSAMARRYGLGDVVVPAGVARGALFHVLKTAPLPDGFAADRDRPESAVVEVPVTLRVALTAAVHSGALTASARARIEARVAAGLISPAQAEQIMGMYNEAAASEPDAGAAAASDAAPTAGLGAAGARTARGQLFERGLSVEFNFDEAPVVCRSAASAPAVPSGEEARRFASTLRSLSTVDDDADDAGIGSVDSLDFLPSAAGGSSGSVGRGMSMRNLLDYNHILDEGPRRMVPVPAAAEVSDASAADTTDLEEMLRSAVASGDRGALATLIEAAEAGTGRPSAMLLSATQAAVAALAALEGAGAATEAEPAAPSAQSSPAESKRPDIAPSAPMAAAEPEPAPKKELVIASFIRDIGGKDDGAASFRALSEEEAAAKAPPRPPQTGATQRAAASLQAGEVCAERTEETAFPRNVNSADSTDSVVAWWSSPPFAGRLESATLKFRWKDQGWGNRKGTVLFRRRASSSTPWTSCGVIAPHSTAAATLELPRSLLAERPTPEPLEIGYRVGGGGGHALEITGPALTLVAVPAATAPPAPRRARIVIPPTASPGAFLQVQVPSGPGATTTVRVQVPAGARPGATLEFALASEPAAPQPPAGFGSGMVRVQVPVGGMPGNSIKFKAPDGASLFVTVPQTATPGSVLSVRYPLLLAAVAEPDVHIQITVPAGSGPGSILTVQLPTGEQRRVTLPPGSVAGRPVQIMVPADAPPDGSPTFVAGGGAWRREQLEARLAKLRIPYANNAGGRVDLTLHRKDFLESALSTLPKNLTVRGTRGLSFPFVPLSLSLFLSPLSLFLSLAAALLTHTHSCTRMAQDWRKTWRFTFAGEPAIDAGGVAREFWEMLSSSLFHPHAGLFKYGATDNLTYQINPLAGILHGTETAGRMFRLTGRLLAKALLDKQLVTVSLNRPLLKHLLALPVAFADLEHYDAGLHKSLSWMLSCGPGEVEAVCQTFTANEDDLSGAEGSHEVELMPGGADIDVTDENKHAFVTARFRYQMMDRIALPLASLLRGFYEVVPEAVLMGNRREKMDADELDVALCGSPAIDLADWKAHTEYQGGLSATKGAGALFWRVVEHDFNDEQRTRLLQFVTGTSRLPAGGFKDLQGVDGKNKRFKLLGIPGGDSEPPRSHTCFNRLDLPSYSSHAHMKEVLTNLVAADVEGFSID